MKVLSPGHDLPESGISAHKFIKIRSPNSNVSHIHELVEMTFLIEGEMINIINDIPIKQKPGELSIISMGSRHYLDFKDVTYFNLYLDLDRFPLEMIPPELIDFLLPLLVPSRQFLHSFNIIQKITFHDPHKVVYCFEEMVKNREEKSCGWEASLLHWGVLILIECARSLERLSMEIKELKGRPSKRDNTRSLGQNNPIMSVCHTLDLNFREPLSLETLSKICGYEIHYMCRKFKEETGVTISTYLHMRRIRQAMHLLTVSTEKITRVALDCGYDDISYFNRQFKKHIRCSPGDYRKRNLGINGL